MLRFLLLPAVVLSLYSTAFAADDPVAILKKADDIRSPSESYRLVVTIDSAGEDQQELRVSIKGKDKTHVQTIKPVRDNGNKMLMIKDEMWSYLPKLKRAVRVNLNQRMSGQAANGDICRQRWSGDYTPEIEKSEKDQWVLMLTAARPHLTYDKIRLWVNKSDNRPDHAEYLTKSGMVLKTAKFQGYKPMAGGTRPTQTVITNAVKKTDVSTITITEMQSMNFPDTLFDQGSLR